MVSGSISSLPGFFHLSSRYWFTIGPQEYLALPDGLVDSGKIPSCPAVLRCCLVLLHYFGYGLSLFRRTSIPFAYNDFLLFADSPYNPDPKIGLGSSFRSPLPRESFVYFFPFRYLDVSVPELTSLKLFIHFRDTWSLPRWVPHSDIDGSLHAYC